MPCDLIIALERAVVILQWQENLLEKEMPPRWMWALDEELVKHFEWVKEQRESPDWGIEDRERDDGPEPLTGPLVLKNEYAMNRGRNALANGNR